MKKLVFIVFALFVGVSYADNVVTSKSYVDTAANNLQTQIDANDANTVLTYTGTAGEVGEKGIYDSSAAYAGQNDNLVTAGAFNTAVQNALDSEFVCIERQVGTGGCLLYQIRAPYNQSPNLFNVNKIPSRSSGGTTLVNNGDGSITVTRSVNNSAVITGQTLQQLAPDLVVGNAYVLSFDTTGSENVVLLYNAQSGNTLWRKNNSLVIQQKHLDSTVYFYPGGGCTDDGRCSSATISNIQIEQGTVATPYVPYGNVYMPQGQ